MKSSFLARWCAVAALLAGCVDTSSIDYQSAADAGTLPEEAGVDSGRIARCRACMNDGGCASETATCNGVTSCKAFSNCLLDRDCVGYDLTNLAHLPPCVLECSVASGAETTDPVFIQAITPFILCAHDQTRCAAECVWQ
jgi:hypothetical protein